VQIDAQEAIQQAGAPGEAEDKRPDSDHTAYGQVGREVERNQSKEAAKRLDGEEDRKREK
jgi:hypothetical protein